MKKMKKLLAMATALTLVAAAFTGCGKNEDGETNTDNDGLKVGIVQYVSHPSLDNCYQGVEEALKEKYCDDITIERLIGSDSSPD